MKPYDKTLTRLILILTKLSNHDLPTIKELTVEFNVGIRTIQRDLYERLIYFPIEKNKQGQLQFIDGFSLDRSTLEEDEMLLIYLAMSQVKTLSSDFENKIDHVFSKLLNPSFKSSFYIQPNNYEQVDLKSTLFRNIEKSIEKFCFVDIELQNTLTQIKPYKIVNINGIWHLLARDLNDEKIKAYTIYQIKKYKLLKNTFKLETNIDEVLSSVHSGWFEDGNRFKVKVEINKNIAHYFKAKKVIHTQEIINEYSNGNIIVDFYVTHNEDIDNIIKSWLPDIRILEPLSYRDKLDQELKQYLKFTNTNKQ